MASTTGEIRYRATLDASNFRRGAREMGRATDDMRRESRGLIGTMGDLANATGITARDVARFTGDALRAAAAAEVVGDSFDRTFGPAAVGLSEDIREVAYSLGLTESEAQALLVPFGQLQLDLGVSRDQAAEFSGEMFTVAGALAAFNPAAGDTSDALNAIGAALRNEFDPLERFGIKLNQTRINTKALEMTGKELASQLTDEEKAMAAVALITEAAGDELDAFGENNQSSAARIREMEARVRDLQVAMGAALLPVLEENQDEIIAIIEALADILPAIAAVVRFIGQMDRATESSTEQWQSMADTFGGWRESTPIAKIKAVRDAVLSLLGPLGDVIRLMDGVLKRFTGVSSIDIAGNIAAGRSPTYSTPSSGSGGVRTGGGARAYAMGGVVPGPLGSPQPIIAHGGERITPPGGGGGDGITIVVNTGIGDPMAIARAVADALSDYNQLIGPVPVATIDRGAT